MVQGKAAVKWDALNDAKLLQAFAAIHSITPNYERLAAVFGPNVPKEAIQYRWNVLRKGGNAHCAAAGLSPAKSTPVTAKVAKGTTLPRAPATKKCNMKRKRRGNLSDVPSDDESTAVDDTDPKEALTSETDDADPNTPGPSAKRQKTIWGKVTKRISPRTVVKKDYKKIGDPFVDLESANDENGNAIFTDEHTPSDNSSASDEDYGNEKVVAVSDEDAV